MRELTKENLAEVIQKTNPTSLGAVAREMGYKGKISGSLGKKIREMVPSINEILAVNRQAQAVVGGKSDGGAAKKVQAKTAPKKAIRNSSKFPRHPKNPFRPTSSYGLVFDVLSKNKDGMTRQELIKKVSEEGKKPATLCSYDVSVVLSAKDSNTGPRHKSCKEGFWIRREADHVTLMID